MRWIEDDLMVHTTLLRSLLGIWTWGALLSRDLLAIPAAVFTMVDRHPDQLIPWWPSAKREWKVMCRVIPLMTAEIGLPPSPLLFATDAGGSNATDAGGDGVVGSKQIQAWS